MAKKLYIGNLSWDTDDQRLQETFARFGGIEEAKVITDRMTNRSRGFGFVTFTDDQAAATAIAEMNGADLDGRSIKVNEARDREPRRSGR